MLTIFGRMAQKLRADKGLSLLQFAILVDRSASYLSRIEHGQINIPEPLLELYVQRLTDTQEEAVELRQAAAEKPAVLIVNPNVQHASGERFFLAEVYAQLFEKLTETQIWEFISANEDKSGLKRRAA